MTRGRANSLRLAISGQLGPDALASDEMLETMKLCVSCKGCRRECPTGVDMAKMKIEVLAAANKRRGLSLYDRLVAYLPRYAPCAARLAPLMNARNAVPGMAWLAEHLTGFSANRQLPRWRRDTFASSLARGLDRLPSPSRGGGPVGARGGGRWLDQGSGVVRRYLQHLLRARELACGGRGAHAPRLPGYCARLG